MSSVVLEVLRMDRSGRRACSRPRTAWLGLAAASVLVAGLVPAAAVAAAPSVAPAATECAGPVTGKVSCWPGELGAGDAVGTNDGSLQNGASIVDGGRVGKAFSFDGVDDQVSVPHDASLDYGPGEKMTISFWMNRGSAALLQHILGKRHVCNAEDFNWQVVFVTDGTYVGSRNSFTSASRVPAIGSWEHWAATQSGNRWRLYRNGDLVASSAGAFGPTNTSPLLFGRSSTCEIYGGLLDEIELWSRALSDDAVAATYRANATCESRPSAPTALSTATVTSTRPKLDWTARGCATTYRLTIRRGSSTGQLVLSRTGLTTSSFKVPALTAGRTYAWRPTACNAKGCRNGSWRTFKVAG